MRLLLDTHAFLWWMAGHPSLSTAARVAIGDADNQVFFSAASACEITTKHRLGKLPGVAAIAGDLEAVVSGQGFAVLPISLRHAQAGGALAGPHRDPFDRMLIAQALAERLTLTSNENLFDAYGVARLW